jgi:putative MATE family efflux protein
VNGRRALAAEVVALAWPATLQGLLGTVVLFTDRLLLGRYSADALGSMQIAGPLLWSVFGVFGAFAVGLLAVAGRAAGAGDAARLRRSVRAALGFAVVTGVAVGAAGWFGRAAIARAMGGGPATSEAVRALARTYLAVVFPAAPAHFAGVAATTALQAMGDTRTPLRIAAVSGTVNLAVAWVLVFGKLGAPELGVTGAAFGGVAAFGVEAALALVAVRASLPRAEAAGEPALRALLRVSLPAFGERALYHTGFLAFAALIGRLGDVAMATHQSLLAIESLGFTGADGFGIAAGALVARKLGARRADDAAACGWIATGLGVAVLSVVGLGFLLFARPLVSIFSTDPDVIALGTRCLRVAAAAQPLMAATDALGGSLRGAGDTRRPLVVAVVGPIVVRLTATWFFAFHLRLGLLGVWLGSTLDWAVRSVWLATLFRGGAWRAARV